MIKFKCPACGKVISAADEHAGRKAKCPGCDTVMVIPGGKPAPPRPAAVEPVEEAPPPPPRKAAPSAVRAGKPRRVEDDVPEVEAVEEVEELEEVPDEVEEEEEERPRRRGRGRKRRRWHGEWADCPNCGAPGDATRLWYTMWGGFIGPMLICHVRCNQCGVTYNGRAGDYNTTRIIIFMVSWIGFVVVLLTGCGILSALINAKP